MKKTFAVMTVLFCIFGCTRENNYSTTYIKQFDVQIKTFTNETTLEVEVEVHNPQNHQIVWFRDSDHKDLGSEDTLTMNFHLPSIEDGQLRGLSLTQKNLKYDMGTFDRRGKFILTAKTKKGQPLP